MFKKVEKVNQISLQINGLNDKTRKVVKKRKDKQISLQINGLNNKTCKWRKGERKENRSFF